MLKSKFRDRKEAGQQLAKKLQHHSNRNDMIVLALPRGGVPVAYEIAKELNYPLDIFLVRKIGIPNNEETAMGAVAIGGAQILNQELIKYLNISNETVQMAINKAQQELQFRNNLYRNNKAEINFRNYNIILVDDGMATGATMQAAILALKKEGAHEIIVAVPVSSESSYEEIFPMVDEVISLVIPTIFHAVGAWYENFPQVSHEEVKELLSKT
ncbi:MAG: phosphoribosyltransferase [Rickettsiales bacterium]|nr:phosphoribosyltransferase [Rickettsiales bacterium]